MEISEDDKNVVWRFKTKKAKVNINEHSDVRQGNGCLFPWVQTVNGVTVCKILLINLETAFTGYHGSWNSNQEAFITHMLPMAICDR